MNSLGVFLGQLKNRFLASFADQISYSVGYYGRPWPRSIAPISILPAGPLKAGYAAPPPRISDKRLGSLQNHAGTNDRFIPRAMADCPIVGKTTSSRHALGPPRKQGQRPHAIADRPATLTPTTSPRLGVESRHQELHRCALRRIFRLALKAVGRLEYCATPYSFCYYTTSGKGCSTEEGMLPAFRKNGTPPGRRRRAFLAI